ncbi:hypothetical protein Q2T40_16205 [Winogradskyella maritima]|uniref:DNA repair exonuclease SbcCD ATPase subunit n=1 Tax=Winogradskyella maritima TaxID=1517766 RepID=A0ABV8AFH4_9FLAO|nr:hypothetical protein [Winogradskyella maritima]
MKDFPRIHSLGTINIIHHQHFDYELHPFRTDFTGDSAVGKSIITDLLQLIIIGSTEYESSTTGQDDRPFNTLVIESSEKGDYGYAYLNIEVAKEEYLLMGCYIERNAKMSQAFIVQGGLDFEQQSFEPFQKPFVVEDFVDEGNLLTLVDLDAKLNQTEHYGCKIYQYFKDYHEALFNNNLLPIDIASSKSALQDYAKILQAFSRKGISVKSDVKLQEFLFGKEKSQTYYNTYLEAVKKFEDSVNTHRANKAYITQMKAKSDNIEKLYELKKLKDKTERVFIEVAWNYQKRIKKQSKKSIKMVLKNYLDARKNLQQLNELKANKLREVQEQINTQRPKEDELTIEFNAYKKRMELLNSAKTVKEELQLNTDTQLQEIIKDYLEQQKFDEALTILNAKLEKVGLTKAFSVIDFNQDLKQIVDQQDDDIKTLKDKLSLAKELIKFNDFNNPETLSYWILNRGKACSPIEESLLRHFQDLNTAMPKSPKADARYIPNPQHLISVLGKEDIEVIDDHFWLNLSGLSIYIKKVEKQIFDTDDSSKIKDVLLETQKENQEQLNKVENRIGNIKTLRSFLLNELSQIPNAIPAWLGRKNEGIATKAKVELAKIAQGDIDQILEDLNNEDKLLKLYQESKKQKDGQSQLLRYLESIEQQLPQIETVDIDTLEEHIETLLEEHQISRKRKDKTFAFQEKSYALDYQKEYTKQNNILNETDQLDKLLEKYDTSKKRILEIETVFPNWLREFSDMKIGQEDYDDSKDKYNNISEAYVKQFDAMLIAYQLQDKSTQFEEDKNFMELVRLLLPHSLFKQISFVEAAVIPKILEHLDEINDSIARLNQNKLRSIRDILQELRSTINNQVSHSRKMNSFFKEDYMIISGENTASLKADFRKDISLKWINDFLANIGKLDYGIFDHENSLTSKLDDLPTIEEKILLAYKEYSPAPLPSVSIRELLNPFSYYTLDYKLLTKSGKKNSGSTGQTYSSIALLCIAKLSLIKDGKVNKNPGLRFLSIDEAEGIGSNFDMLKELAEEFDYQIISIGINPNKLSRKNQYIYRLSKRKDHDRINHQPSVIFSEL